MRHFILVPLVLPCSQINDDDDDDVDSVIFGNSSLYVWSLLKKNCFLF